MSIGSTIKLALKSIIANKLRTVLTVLGIVIGITAVIVVYSAGAGIKDLVVGQVESFGTDFIEIEIKVPSTQKGESSDIEDSMALAQGAQVTTLKIKDFDDINKLPNVDGGYAAIIGQEKITYASESKKSLMYGVTAEFINIDKSEIDQGRFFTDGEDKSLAMVAVLGQDIKDDLFGDSDPIGKYIKIRGKKFQVIGVLKERGSMMTMDFDDLIYVPFRSLQKKVMGIDYAMFFVHKIEDMSIADYTAEEMRYVLRDNHDITDPSKDDFRVVTMDEMMEMLNTITGAITLMLVAIVIISLIVGGVGILNIMYVIVSERTSEIGLRKAVGAKFSEIMWQFLLEAVIITMIGAVIGIILGIFISWGLAFALSQYGLDWKFIVPLEGFVVALLFSLVFGIFFGVYPARKAAKLDPIDALRKK